MFGFSRVAVLVLDSFGAEAQQSVPGEGAREQTGAAGHAQGKL